VNIAQFLSDAAGFAWSLPLVTLLIAAGLLFTFANGGVQFRAFWHSLKVIAGKYDRPGHKGEITHFQALSAALSATVGLGNISGVAVAISAGGPGAIFWMWIAGLVGMATKFVTCTLAVKYRKIDKDGVTSGGPMYYIELGLGRHWKPVAVVFAFMGAMASFGAGNMFQSNQSAAILNSQFGFPAWATGVILAIAVGLVIIGGIKRIGQVASKLVPTMAAIYFLGAAWMLLTNFDAIPGIFGSIINDAFSGTAAVGGFAGVAVRQVVIQGVRRAVFSNEAGLGSAPIAHAAAKTEEPVREGVVAMLGPFIDTILICSMTAFVILLSGEWMTGQTSGVDLTVAGFESGMPGFGRYFVALAVFLFAYSTALSWSYYGEKCTEYLLGRKAIMGYKIVFVVCVFIGAVGSLQPVLDFSDTMLAMMALPNLIGTIALMPGVARDTKKYFGKLRRGEFDIN
jgi:AGCS family alanine or glycine:cation symporter